MLRGKSIPGTTYLPAYRTYLTYCTVPTLITYLYTLSNRYCWSVSRIWTQTDPDPGLCNLHVTDLKKRSEKAELLYGIYFRQHCRSWYMLFPMIGRLHIHVLYIREGNNLYGNRYQDIWGHTITSQVHITYWPTVWRIRRIRIISLDPDPYQKLSWIRNPVQYQMIRIRIRVEDPDPYWIRIQELPASGSVFQIRIQIHTCKYSIG